MVFQLLAWTVGCGLGDVGADIEAWKKAQADLDLSGGGQDADHAPDAIPTEVQGADGTAEVGPDDTSDPGKDADSLAPPDALVGGDTSDAQASQDGLGGDVALPECATATDCAGDSGVCHQWSCQGGQCQPTAVPDGLAVVCALDQECHTGGVCLAGACTATTADPCDDGNPCTTDACLTNQCSHWATTGPCDDNDPCTLDDTCEEQACSGLPKDCGDANACTTDTCLPTGACAHLPANASCTDDDLCTDDACDNGACVGTQIVCMDGLVCTDDNCLPSTGCSFNFNQVPCDDGDPCTLDDHCALLVCAGKPALFAQSAAPAAGDKVAVWSDVLVEADGSATLYGTSAPSDNSPGAWRAQRLDPTGTPVWTEQQPQSAGRLAAAATLTDGSHLLVGDHLSKTNGTRDGLVRKVGKGGKVMGTWSYGGAFQDALLQVATLETGGWLLVGTTSKAASGGAAADLGWVVRASADGTVAAQSTPGGALPSTLDAVIGATQGTQAVVCGKQLAGETARSWLVGLNADLGLRWQRLGDPGSACLAMVRRPDASLLWVGRDGSQAVIEATSAQGRRLWRLVSGSELAPGFLSRVRLLADGSALATGAEATDKMRILGLRVARHGAKLDSFLWGDAPLNLTAGLRLDPQGRAIVVGAQGDPKTSTHALTLRLTPWGHASCAAADKCGAPLPGQCDDGNPCTDDGCTPKVGCASSMAAAPCDDGDACTVGARCEGGKCKPGHLRSAHKWFEPETIAPVVAFSDTGSPVIARLPGGGYALAAAHSIGNGKTSTRVIRLDAAGNQTWKKSQIGVGHERPLAIAAAQDGSILVVGARDEEGFVTYLTPAGEVTATVPVVGDGARMHAVVSLAPQTAVMVGERGDTVGGKKVRALWWMRLGPPQGLQQAVVALPATDLHPRKLLALEDGSWATAGSQWPHAGKPLAWLANLDTKGGLLWQKSYGALSETAPFAGLARTPSGGFVLAGSLGESPAMSSIVVTGTSRNGDLLWTWKRDPKSPAWAGALGVLNDGSVFIAGNLYDGGKKSPTLFARLSTAGELLHEAVLPINGFNLPTEATLSVSGDPVIAIGSEPKAAGSFWPGVLLLDGWGHVSCASAGQCADLSPLDCADGLPCTRDRCLAATGCASTADAKACDDENPCTLGDVCVAAACLPGAALGCDDDQQCTLDACDPAAGCTHKLKTDGLPCTDGNPCQEAKSCSAGACAGGKPKDCSDDVACTADTCSTSVGGCTHALQDSKCDDGNACTSDSCKPSGCSHLAKEYGTPCQSGVDNLVCSGTTCAAPWGAAVATGSDFTCALKVDGTIWCWGAGSSGQTGNGTEAMHTAPFKTSGLSQMVSVEAGFRHACARRTDGVLFCWGLSKYGQILVAQPQGNAFVPMGLKGVDASGGYSLANVHSCALDKGGKVVCFGSALYDQMEGAAQGGVVVGITQIGKGLTGITGVTANPAVDCALDGAQTVWCVGATSGLANPNVAGQTSKAFVQVLAASAPDKPLSNIVKLRRGTGLTLAIDVEGKLHAWGSAGSDLAGWKSTLSNLVSIPDTVVDATSGGSRICAVSAKGDVWCVGSNPSTILGDPTATLSGTLHKVPGLSKITSISAWDGHTCAMRADGAVFCWGANSSGQCGAGEVSQWRKPTAVKGTLPLD